MIRLLWFFRKNPPASFSTSGNFSLFLKSLLLSSARLSDGYSAEQQQFWTLFYLSAEYEKYFWTDVRTMSNNEHVPRAVFLAAIEEIDTENLPSHNQAYPYPESSDSTEYDDLLLSNMFPAVDEEFTLLTLVTGLLGDHRLLHLHYSGQNLLLLSETKKWHRRFLLVFFGRLHRISAGQIYARIFLVACFSAFMIFLGVFSFLLRSSLSNRNERHSTHWRKHDLWSETSQFEIHQFLTASFPYKKHEEEQTHLCVARWTEPHLDRSADRHEFPLQRFEHRAKPGLRT